MEFAYKPPISALFFLDELKWDGTNSDVPEGASDFVERRNPHLAKIAQWAIQTDF